VQLRKPRYGDSVEVEVERLDPRGRAIGSTEHESGRYKAVVRSALPGELVRAQVLRRRRAELDVREVERLRTSPERVAPRCAHFGVCGGCRFQDLEYSAQLRTKREWVQQLFERAGVRPERIDETHACATPWRYRNKMDFTFGSRRWVAAEEPQGVEAGFALGLHPREQHLKVLSVESCPIQFEAGDGILRDARRLALEQGLSAWDVRAHTGLLRHLVLRASRASGEILVQLTTSSEARELVEPYVRALLAAQPCITTLVQAVSARLATVAGGGDEIVWSGSGRIRERLAGLWFEISAGAFFQTNTEQAETLVELALGELAPSGDERVLDLYCGAGAFSLPLAQRVRAVQGVELVEAAVVDARRNAELNAVTNAQFDVGDAAQWLGAAAASEPFELVLVDPPRAGIHAKALAVLRSARARRMVYVSCNPESAARDIAALSAGGWLARRVQPVDLFPHTPHVECVITLERGA
jgi:23S rRNA (uracil1939-C5)-methyltransferase